MDQYLSTVICTLIAGIFGIVPLFIQERKNKKAEADIENSWVIINTKDEIKQRLAAKEKDLDQAFNDVMMLILETNLMVLRTKPDQSSIDQSVYKKAEELKLKIDRMSDEIDDINHEYNLVLGMAAKEKKKKEMETEGG